MVMRTIKEFIKLESTSGLLLFIVMIAALIISNSPWQHDYSLLTTLPFSLRWGDFVLIKTLTAWVNEGFMTLFFLMVGLEIKQETLASGSKNIKPFILPGIGALGGMLVPALIYLSLNGDNPFARTGWAIPTATDTAFALSLLALFGKNIRVSVKVFLMTLAILDDVFAIIIIALFYNYHLSYLLIVFASICTLALITLNRRGIKHLLVYWLFGVLLWLSLLESGIHAILAGVIFAFTIPINSKTSRASPLQRMQKGLHPWVAYAILPFFVFINAGISFHGISIHFLTHPIALGIILGLFLGKPLGIFLFCWLAVHIKITKLIPNMTWLDLLSVAMLCGVGFTVSLFIGNLAFNHDKGLLSLVKLGVLVGSLLSGCLGCMLCYLIKNARTAGKTIPIL